MCYSNLILLQIYAQILKWIAGVLEVLLTRLSQSVITIASKEKRHTLATYLDIELSNIFIGTFFAQVSSLPLRDYPLVLNS